MSVTEKSYQNKEALELLGKIYSLEIAGVTRYLHYSFMIMGYNRIPIQSWFRSNANESMQHAIIIGEKITSLGGHPPMVASRVEEKDNHSVAQLLTESLNFEAEAMVHYKDLVKVAVKLEDIALEELARGMVREETEHADEVRKMLQAPH
ncbi:MAG TPA: ferritin-like domain-containing protein [Oligoflexus sp.]|uniref:ferritin-like domain-containing protein n=1 Tax=Oligoflexus sp. TaxID=1971216 RepID=UPI002D289334|nr:ferritin-like domain-containing protein [Oligoflexus sp.]HYX34510.1 ferritin-like domain-containing protein [Oligoflexus sp.]